MAGTYYGYAERNADAYVDWREVSQYTTDMLDETMRLRQEKKDALDKVARDALKFAANAPVGADVSVRKKALVMSDMVSKNILMMKKKMESGDLDPRDWLIYQQNALDTIDLSFNAFKIYQEDYASTMEGIKNKELSILTADNIGFAETYGNLETLGFTMSPEGNILMGKEVETEVDGVKVKKLEGLTSVNALNGLIANKINHNKIEDQVNTYVKSLGVEKRATAIRATYNKQGQVKTIEDITSRKSEDPAAFQFREAELEQARAMIGEPSNIASILIDTKKVASNGKPYETTDDENEAKRDPSKILRVFTPNKGYNIVVSKEQEQDAIDFTLNRMRERYKYEETIDIGGQIQDQRKVPTQADTDRGILQKQRENIASSWGNIFKAVTPEAKRAEAEAILGSDLSKQQGLIDLDFTVPNKITFIYSDPIKNRTINYDSGKTTLRQWNQLGNEVHGIDNIDEVMRRNQGGNPNMVMSEDQRQFGGVKVGRQIQASNNIDYTDDVQKYVTKNTETNVVEDDPKKTAQNLETKYRKLNFTFKGESRGIANQNDFIQIKAPDGVTSDWIPVDNLDNVDFINQFIIDHSAGQDYSKVWPNKTAAAGGTTASGGTVRE